MKKPILLLTATAFSYLLLTGYSTGLVNSPSPQNRTGAGGSSGNCSGTSCHPSNNSNLSLSIQLYDLVGGNVVSNNKYKPGTAYQIRITGSNSGGGGPYPFFGYQFTTASEGISNGAFFAIPGDLQANVIAPYEILEQRQPLASQGLNTFRDTFNWLSPSAGNGDVTLYLTLMGANGDGSINGDITNNATSIFQEEATSVPDIDKNVKTTVYPNPAKDILNFSMANAVSGDYTISVYDPKGSVLQKKTLAVSGSDAQASFNISSLAAGNYFLLVKKDNAQRVISFVKQ